MATVHAPFIAREAANFGSERPGPHLIHSFGNWAYAGLLAADRLRGRGIETIRITSAYNTYESESRSHVQGLTASSSIAARVRFRARHLWIMLAAVPFERRAYIESRLVLYNYDSVLRLIRATYDLPRCLKVPYSSESAFRPPSPTGPVPTPVAGLKRAGAPLVIALSRHQPRKGVDVLLRALKILSGNGVAFRACLLGDGELLEADRRLCAALGLAGSVAITGAVPDSQEYLRHADLFVLPSRHEQSGSLALIEALGAGVPAVASACDGIPEDVTDGHDALLATPGDAESLAAALGRALADRGLRERLAAAGRETFRRRFSAEAFTEALGRVYADLGFGA
jgi:glycosyltransferase involved in cell wall biosynthesis